MCACMHAYMYVCAYVLHSSVSLHMQSVTDVAATQKPLPCELILSVLVAFMLCAHLRLNPTSSCMVYCCVLPCGGNNNAVRMH